MVLEKRLEYGFTGYQGPVVPRSSRSARGKAIRGKKCDNIKSHAFEILARVAGIILQENKISASENAECVQIQSNRLISSIRFDKEKGQMLRLESCEPGSSDHNTSPHKPWLQEKHQIHLLNEPLYTRDNSSLEISHNLKECKPLLKRFLSPKLVGDHGNITLERCSSKRPVESSCYGKQFDGKVDDAADRKPEADLLRIKTVVRTGNCSACMEYCSKPLAKYNHVSDINVLLGEGFDLSPFPDHHVNKKINRRCNNERSLWHTQPNNKGKAYGQPSVIGGKRIKKLSATDEKVKLMPHNESTSHYNQRSQRNYPFKKRRFFRERSLFTFEGDTCSEGILDCSRKRADVDYPDSAVEVPTSVRVQQAPDKLKDCNVKLSIKSFKVPELYVEVPATATIGLLKKRVLEAVSASLQDGLHVGILLQGKKIKDDSKTLLQSGISQHNKLHGLGFVLEPGNGKIRSSPCRGVSHLPPGSVHTSWRLSRHLVSSASQQEMSDIPWGCQLTRSSCTENDQDVVRCPINDTASNTMSKSRAIVAVPTASVEALAVVPYRRKHGQPEFVQRRIRRPFTVSEVEALVQAVEKLGTGRWRDVKLRAFNSAKHRTYVDLKDKWKTLVHTARISPQQRRGEPVPQELLDRVIAAHAYWSQQQTTQQ